mmetsp:Transcript_719/g.2518  ORF Transcript_719/g.2518 Transcript_719/m.2518 type:complete len:205 (+) Transcript_719:574-1188(+)
MPIVGVRSCAVRRCSAPRRPIDVGRPLICSLSVTLLSLVHLREVTMLCLLRVRRDTLLPRSVASTTSSNLHHIAMGDRAIVVDVTILINTTLPAISRIATTRLRVTAVSLGGGRIITIERRRMTGRTGRSAVCGSALRWKAAIPRERVPTHPIRALDGVSVRGDMCRTMLRFAVLALERASAVQVGHRANGLFAPLHVHNLGGS